MTAVRKELRRRRKPLWLATTIVALTGVLVFALGASSTIGTSPFEIDPSTPSSLPGANLKVDGPAPAIDWASVSETRKVDTASGPLDESFTQGTKEDTEPPVVEFGSIPPNKSDLKTMGFQLVEPAAGGRYLELFWHRVQEPNGTTNMDFEFNKSDVISANGYTPVRTEGDALIQYDLSRGGTVPTLWLSRWVVSGPTSQCEASNSLPCWSDKVNLSAAGVAVGSINNVAIPAAESDGLGAISPRTFGEAEIDLTALTGGDPGCSVFGSAYLKSRSSDSFTSALKDFIPPVTLDIDQCANVVIRKVTVPATDPAALQFGYTKDIDTSPDTADTFTLGHLQSKSYDNVLLGNDYTVVEDVIPPNWGFTSLDCSASSGIDPADIQIVGAQVTFDINDADDSLDCTYTNTRLLGAILVTKTRKHAADGPGDHPHAGVPFTVDGVTKSTDADGEACFDGLPFGSYSVHETTPAGYHGEADKTVVVDNSATCADVPFGGETVAFHNTPLTNVTLSVDSQIPGGTASVVVCNGVTSNTNPDGDLTVSLPDLEPTAPAVTVNCTVTVDP
jgi:Prealbumin-like fold domain